MRQHTLLRVCTRMLVPLILIFALYVQFHGDYGPGGGFQAGVIFAAGIVLYALVFGVEAARRAVPATWLRILSAGGVLLFAGTGVVSMLAGHNFLDYDALAGDPVAGQHIGIILVEFGVGMTVTGVILSFFYVFAGRGRRD
ncbi:MAG: cation:proton antiporter [Salinisphaeraceae bacterium]|jgi:multicomponent Na+:H+ antiporter subunit B|nr:cation:proton antiporter [Salinisphaeraceae bacterium]